MEDPHPFIDEMRGVTQAKRTATREEHADSNETQPDRKGAFDQEKINARAVAKRRRIQLDIAIVLAGTFQASDNELDCDRMLMDDPNKRTDQAKTLFRNELGIDENWTPREAKCNDQMRDRFAQQVLRDGLILSEAILKHGLCCALSGTLTHPLGSEWKKINGHQGVMVAAKTLQERAGVFPGVQLKKHDAANWFTCCYEGVINRIRVKHWGNDTPIPDGAIIFMAVVHAESVCYQNLEMFGEHAFGCNPNHAMCAIHNGGPFVIPSHWVKFEHRQGIAPALDKLPYTQPNVTGEDFVDVVFS
jgi:hypothetical protein